MIHIAFSIFLIALFGRFISGFGAWYLIVLAGFFGSLPLKKNIIVAFFTGFAGGFLGWYWLLHHAVENELAGRMAEVIGVGTGIKLILLSCAIGGLVAAFGAVCSNVLKGRKNKEEY